jgi:hypothetical protein
MLTLPTTDTKFSATLQKKVTKLAGGEGWEWGFVYGFHLQGTDTWKCGFTNDCERRELEWAKGCQRDDYEWVDNPVETDYGRCLGRFSASVLDSAHTTSRTFNSPGFGRHGLCPYA